MTNPFGMNTSSPGFAIIFSSRMIILSFPTMTVTRSFVVWTKSLHSTERINEGVAGVAHVSATNVLDKLSHRQIGQ